MKNLKNLRHLVLSLVLILFAASCSSDDDAPAPDDDPVTQTAKVKEIRRIMHDHDFVINGIENALVFDYDTEGKISHITNKVVNENPAENYDDHYAITYNSDGTIQKIQYTDGFAGENATTNFGYSDGKLSSLTESGGTLDISYNAAGNYFSYQFSSEFPVCSIYFNSNGNIAKYDDPFWGTKTLTTNSNEGVYVETPMNQELKIYLIMRSLDPSGYHNYFLTKELTKIETSGETIFGPIEGTVTTNIINVVRNSDGLIESYWHDGDGNVEMRITYVE